MTEFTHLLTCSRRTLSDSALSKSRAIESHIVKLALRKLAVSAINDRRGFDTTDKEQKRLATEGIKIIKHDLGEK